MGLDPSQFRTWVIEPTLHYIGLHSEAAVRLVLGTAMIESGLEYIDQLGDKPGPAYGIYQMEEATYRDTMARLDRPYMFALGREGRTFQSRVLSLVGDWPEDVTRLHGNLFFATAMARAYYYLDRHPLPAADDIEGLAAYYKRVWNTELGATSIAMARRRMAEAVEV